MTMKLLNDIVIPKNNGDNSKNDYWIGKIKVKNGQKQKYPRKNGAC